MWVTVSRVERHVFMFARRPASATLPLPAVSLAAAHYVAIALILAIYLLYGLGYGLAMPFAFGLLIDRVIPSGDFGYLLGFTAVLFGLYLLNSTLGMRRAWISSSSSALDRLMNYRYTLYLYCSVKVCACLIISAASSFTSKRPVE